MTAEWLFFICRTCKKIVWINENEILSYIRRHMGHEIWFLDKDIYETPSNFEKWFKRFMGWKDKGDKDCEARG